MPFYRILGVWDEMAREGDLDVDDTGERANQQARDGEREKLPAPNRNICGGVLCYSLLYYYFSTCSSTAPSAMCRYQTSGRANYVFRKAEDVLSLVNAAAVLTNNDQSCAIISFVGHTRFGRLGCAEKGIRHGAR